MTCPRPYTTSARDLLTTLLLLTCFTAAPLSRGLADDEPAPAFPPALEKPVPESIGDLRAIQEQVRKVLDKVLPCTVGVRAGGGQGSGVIVSADGYVLTAAHVSGPAGRDVTLVLPDGREVKGKTLGANRTIDSGLIKISTKGPWPFVEMGSSADVKSGQWCVAAGHPGGYHKGRTPVVRVGRVLQSSKTIIQSDCVLVGGDSGGPLFNMHGKVIGIHSRIGNSIAANIHVPVDTYRDTWDRLVQSEVWGEGIGGKASNRPYLGVEGDTESSTCRIVAVSPGSPAAKAGLKAEDVVLKFGGKTVGDFQDLVAMTAARRPGDEVTLEVQRGDTTVRLRLVVGKRPE